MRVPLHSQEAFARPNAHCMRGEIVGLTGTSVVVEDAITKTRKELSADVVVFATGYRESLEIFGELFLSKPIKHMFPVVSICVRAYANG